MNVELLSREIEGISFKKEIFIGNIYSDNIRQIVIPIKGKSYLNTGIAHFNIEINERFGNIPNPISLKIGTNNYIQPEIVIKEAQFATDEGGYPKLSYPVYLRLLIENISSKDIKNLEVDVSFDNPACILLEDSKFIISSLESQESLIKEVIFTSKKNYPFDIIPIKLHFHDKYKMYSEVKSVFLDLNQKVASRKALEEQEAFIESSKLLVSDVDTNIPYDSIIYPDRFALIIGNEDYTKHQPTLKSESNVIYAKNDAIIFRKYAINTYEKKHGFFTYFLLKKLKETKGYITYGELSDFLTKEVAIESLRINSKEQDPKVNISENVQDIWKEWSFKDSSE